MSVKKLGPNRWQVQVRDDLGAWFERKTFISKDEAVAYEGDCYARRAKGRKAATTTSQDLTFDEYWERWTLQCRENVSPGWQISQDQMYRDYLKPAMGHVALSKCDRELVMAVLVRAKQLGRGEQTRIHLWALMHKLFADAIEHFEYLEVNPVLKKYRPNRPRIARAYLKPDEAWRFLEHASRDRVGVGLWLMTLDGLRISEVRALQWKHVDLKSGQLTVCRQWNFKTRQFLDWPKNRTPNIIPIPPVLIDFLMGRKPLGASPEDLVLQPLRNNGGATMNYRTIAAAIDRVCKKAEVQRLTPHELRHTCSEIWIDNGATKEDIRRLFNQSSETAVNTYIHRTPERLARISRIVAKPAAAGKPGLRLVGNGERGAEHGNIG